MRINFKMTLSKLLFFIPLIYIIICLFIYFYQRNLLYHPGENNYLDELSHIEKNLVEDKNIVAIGEIGIDLHWDESNLDLQKKAFERQIELSNNFNLPIIIHCRESFNEIYRILKQKPVRNGGIFHCFTGNLDQFSLENVSSYGRGY